MKLAIVTLCGWVIGIVLGVLGIVFVFVGTFTLDFYLAIKGILLIAESILLVQLVSFVCQSFHKLTK